MKNFLLIILLFSTALSCTRKKDTGVHFSGEFPDLKATNALFVVRVEENGRMVKYRTLIKNGKFNLTVDSLKKGVYNAWIEWPVPFENRRITSRNHTGVVVSRYLPKTVMRRSIGKRLYINPEQSRNYYVLPAKPLTQEMIDRYDSVSYLRTDLYRLTVVSEAADTKLYEELESERENFMKFKTYQIFDSLYQASRKPDKIADDYRGTAWRINLRKNYPVYLKNKRDIIRKHLNSPIAALDFLDIKNEQLLNNIDEYESLLNRMRGRAKESPYYQQAKLKLDAMKNPLAIGNVSPLPTGDTPQSEQINFNPSDYNFTLLEFWASWCAPCREQNPQWNDLLSKYKDTDFKILGISLDKALSSWKAAIRQDGLDQWLHISDLGDSFNGSNALRYGIQAIPFNILIDRKGLIVAKEISPNELDSLLENRLATTQLEVF